MRHQIWNPAPYSCSAHQKTWQWFIFSVCQLFPFGTHLYKKVNNYTQFHLRLGFHVLIFFFFTSFCEWFNNKRQHFFCTVYTLRFFHSSAADSEMGEKSNLSRSIFRLNFVHPCGMWTQLYLILSILLSTFTRLAAILRGHVVRSTQRSVGKKLQWSAWTQSICFNAIYLCRY